MIYAKLNKKYGGCYAFDTKYQHKVENAMILMGYGGSEYNLSSGKPSKHAYKVKVLDKWGYKFEVKDR